MKTLSDEFRDHIDGSATTLCNCWQIYRTDGEILGFTDHDENLEFDGIIHAARTSMDPSDAETFAKLSPGSLELAGALDSQAISPEDIKARKYDDARIVHHCVNWQNVTERLRLHTWIMGDVSSEDGVFKFELRSIAALLEKAGLRRFERLCNAQLGDERCGVDLQRSFSEQAVLDRMTTKLLIEISGLQSHSDAWFVGGEIIFSPQGGPTHKIEIVADRLNWDLTRSIELWSPIPQGMAIGDQLTLKPGCDKRFSTCRMKFDNGLNFRGFPHMPTSEFISSYAANSKKMDGGAIFVDE